MSVMTAESTTMNNLSLTLDSALSPRPTGTKQQGASGHSFCCNLWLQHSIRAGVAAERQLLLGVTGLPSQHLSADWQSGRGCTVLPHLCYMCVAVTFKFVCEIRGNDTSSA